MTRTVRQSRPAKPYPDFVLQAHGSGQWARRIRGRWYYFGSWSKPWEEAFAEWERRKPFLLAGLPIPDDGDTVNDLLVSFLKYKRAQLEASELTAVSFNEHAETCRVIGDCWGDSRPIKSINSEALTKLRAALGASEIVAIKLYGNCMTAADFSGLRVGIA